MVSKYRCFGLVILDKTMHVNISETDFGTSGIVIISTTVPTYKKRIPKRTFMAWQCNFQAALLPKTKRVCYRITHARIRCHDVIWGWAPAKRKTFLWKCFSSHPGYMGWAKVSASRLWKALPTHAEFFMMLSNEKVEPTSSFYEKCRTRLTKAGGSQTKSR